MHKAASNLREAQSQVIDQACEVVVRGETGSILRLLKACSFGQTITMAQRSRGAQAKAALASLMESHRSGCKTS